MAYAHSRTEWYKEVKFEVEERKIKCGTVLILVLTDNTHWNKAEKCTTAAEVYTDLQGGVHDHLYSL